LQSPSRGALAVVEQKESHDFKSESAAESCAQDANDPALWTRVAKRRLSQNSTEPKGSEADHREDQEPKNETETFAHPRESVRGAAPSELKSYAFPPETLSSMERRSARQISEGPQFAVAKRKVEDAKQNHESKPVQNQQGKDEQEEAAVKESSQPANQRFNAHGSRRKRGKKKNPNRKRGGVKKRRCNPQKEKRDSESLKKSFGNTTSASEKAKNTS
jgi:hypothetical protein